MTQATKQNAPYGYYELGLRADMLEVELKAACQACTHLHEKLEAAEADWRASAERYDREVVQLRSELLLAAAARDAFDEKLKEAEAEAAKWRDDAARLLQAKDAAEARAERAEKALAAAQQATQAMESAWGRNLAELEAAAVHGAHLDEKLKEAEARAEAASTRQAELQAALDEANGRIRDMNTAAQRDAKDWAQANVDRDRYKAKLQAVEALLKKPGCWSEWARECLAVISGGGK